MSKGRTITISRDKHDPLRIHNDRQRKRLSMPKVAKAVKGARLEDLQERIAERDALLLKDKRKDIARRKKLFRAIQRFESLLKIELGRQISVETGLSDIDEVNTLVYFKPKKGQSTFDSDPLIDEAFKKSKLNSYMEWIGSGTMIDTGLRDNHFIEMKWCPDV